ncbi:hypothetical protein [Klebsiella pasteurii]|uniref:GAP1-N1 domain-containing protein n=1 Tax=Klebsiella pasteurii TaxID=2587529 RepID=UPI003B42B00D
MEEIEIHQCIYGYENGHRLLATSMSLPPDVSTTLLLLSDLAPGLMLPSSEGYWTGVPLPGAKVYALMYTWMAYEMPRPGCVWSHVLLIPFPEMARLRDLSILSKYILRPDLDLGFDNYNRSINLNPKVIENINNKKNISTESINEIINAVYNLSGKVKVESSIKYLDDSIFCIWSQQWPRLRRSFSFRTASNSHGKTLDKNNRFDVSIVRNSTNALFDKMTSTLEKSVTWEKVAINDAMSSGGTTFRQYLWRYGTDIISGRKSFKYISELYSYTFENELKGEMLFNFLRKIIHYFPSINEAKTLKFDIVFNGKFSFFPSVNQLDLVVFYMLNDIQESLPSLNDDILHSIILNCDRVDEILNIGEKSVGNESDLSVSFLNMMLLKFQSDNFFSLTKSTPKLKRYLLSNKPSLMDGNEFLDITIDEKMNCIDLIPLDDLALAKSMMLRMLNVDNYELASKVHSRFKESTVDFVFSSFEENCLNKSSVISEAWIKIIDDNPEYIIEHGAISKSKSTIALYKYFTILKSSDLLFSVDIKDWSACLKLAVDNIEGIKRAELILYLFELGLKKPTRDCEVIFENFFDEVHGYFERSDFERFNHFIDKLPDLGWFSNWDNCKRLRVAIVNTYVLNKLSSSSFMRLTRSKNIYSELVRILLDTTEGKEYLGKLI